MIVRATEAGIDRLCSCCDVRLRVKPGVGVSVLGSEEFFSIAISCGAFILVQVVRATIQGCQDIQGICCPSVEWNVWSSSLDLYGVDPKGLKQCIGAVLCAVSGESLNRDVDSLECSCEDAAGKKRAVDLVETEREDWR